MGFDLIGVKATNEKGEYFWNSNWRWSPLWKYVYETCKDILIEEDFQNGRFNDQHFIDSDKATRIAVRLEHLLNQCEVKKYAKERQDVLDNLLDEVCDFCHGTGERNNVAPLEKCNSCKGKGKVRPWICYYPFNEENVKDFVEFCKNSGGFNIC